MTSQPTLFDDFERSDQRRAPRREGSFDFLNRSAWPAAENMRTTLEAWFLDYPDGVNKKDLLARFHDRKRDYNHNSAFFELFLHQVFLRLGLAPEVHPKPITGRGRPDFSIRDSNGLYYVEANAAEITGVLAGDALEDEVLDALDSLAVEKPGRIALGAATEGTLHRSAPLQSIKKEVREWVAGINPALITPWASSGNPQREIWHDAWTLTLTAVCVLPRPSSRLLHMDPMKMSASNDAESIRKNLLEKAKQHGDLDRPLILVMNTPRGFLDAEDEMSALFGQEQVILKVSSDGDVLATDMSREPEAVWRDHSGTRYTRVHGVLFFRGVTPWNAHNATSCVYLNPYIDADIPDELLRLGRAHAQGDTMTWAAGEPLGDILGLPKDWPGELTPERYTGNRAG